MVNGDTHEKPHQLQVSVLWSLKSLQLWRTELEKHKLYYPNLLL